MNPFQKERESVCADCADGVFYFGKFGEVLGRGLGRGTVRVYADPPGEGSAFVAGFIIGGQKNGDCGRQDSTKRDGENRSVLPHAWSLAVED